MSDRYFRPTKVSAFRTLAAVSWDAPRDPTILGNAEIDAEKLQNYLRQLRETTGVKVSMTHAVARAAAACLGEHPELNCLIRRGRVWQRRDVDVFCQIAVPSVDGKKLQGADLSGTVLRQCDKMTTVDIAKNLEEMANRIRNRDDPVLAKTKKNLKWMPPWLAKPMLRLLSYLNHDWGVNLTWLGVPDDGFGSIMVTSLGMYGIRHGFAPLFPAARTIGVIMVGGVYDKPVAINGQVVVRPVLPISIAMDHRVIDGLQASVLAYSIMTRLESPELLDDLLATVPPPGRQTSGVIQATPLI